MLKISQIWPIGQSPFDMSLLFFEGKPWYLRGKESTCNVGDPGLIPGLGRSPGEENGNPLQYSYLENSVDRGAWWATVHGVAESWMWLNDNCIVLWALSYYLTQSDIPDSSCRFPVPALESAITLRSPGFFQLGVVFKSWDLGAKCAHCVWGATASRCGQS